MEIWGDQVAQRLCESRRFALSKYEIVDQISRLLPDHIIHLILDHLPLKDAARLSVLSKNWKSFLTGYPILFGLQFLLAAESALEPNIHEIRERFMDFVDDCLSNVIRKSTPVRKLALNVAVNDSKCFPRVDRLMELVVKLKRVEELCLFVQTSDSKWDDDIEEGDVFYSVPFSVLGSKGLCSLHIRGCNFASLSQNNFSSTICSSLRQLSLLHAVFDEQVVVNLTRCCPGIEVLELDNCNFRVESLLLSAFPRLKKASFLENRGWLEMITFDNISLESFKSNSMSSSYEFIPAACGNVKELIIRDAPNELCVDLTNTFPLLEEADLVFICCCLRTFKVANHHLRKLSCSFRHFKYQVKEFYIDCPNLTHFCYSGDEFPVVKTTSVVTNIYFEPGIINNFSIPWFIQLRGAIGQMAQVGRVVHVHFICCVKMVEFLPMEFEAFQASPQIVHVELIMLKTSNLTNPAALVDGLILSTRPTTLTVSGHPCRDFIKDLCEKLAAKPPCEEFCNKCWWHHLEDFEIENSIRTEINKKNLGHFNFGIENSIRTEVNKKNLADFVEMDRPYLMKSCFKFFWGSNQVRNAPLEQ